MSTPLKRRREPAGDDEPLERSPTATILDMTRSTK